ncbi:hypothetical protein Dimus_022403, partial [Dionaea muscipula]
RVAGCVDGCARSTPKNPRFVGFSGDEYKVVAGGKPSFPVVLEYCLCFSLIPRFRFCLQVRGKQPYSIRSSSSQSKDAPFGDVSTIEHLIFLSIATFVPIEDA